MSSLPAPDPNPVEVQPALLCSIMTVSAPLNHACAVSLSEHRGEDVSSAEVSSSRAVLGHSRSHDTHRCGTREPHRAAGTCMLLYWVYLAKHDL